MRIAVMTDVHANLPALQAALRDIGEQGCDEIYHTGDAIGIGPYPAECLDVLLTTRTMRCVLGNHDAWFALGLPDPWPYVSGELVHQRWVHAQLDPALRAVVATWPLSVEEAPDGVGVTFLHYAPTEEPGRFVPIIQDPRPEDLNRLFARYSSPLLFYGHHHPFSDLTGRLRYVNPGSLGCHTAPLARYTLLETRPDGRFILEHRAVLYDAAPLFVEMERRQVPERDFIHQVFLRQDQR
jgi:predicted phosphodiesterase